MNNDPVDQSYWRREHPHPLAPNAHDVALYRELIGDARTVLLLGNTPALMPLCTAALDLDPWDETGKSIRGDWTQNDTHFEAIIGDGVLNFTDGLARGVWEMAARTSDVFVARAFRHRMPIMRVADNFPGEHDLGVAPTRFVQFDEYQFFQWNFRELRASGFIH